MERPEFIQAMTDRGYSETEQKKMLAYIADMRNAGLSADYTEELLDYTPDD